MVFFQFAYSSDQSALHSHKLSVKPEYSGWEGLLVSIGERVTRGTICRESGNELEELSPLLRRLIGVDGIDSSRSGTGQRQHESSILVPGCFFFLFPSPLNPIFQDGRRLARARVEAAAQKRTSVIT